MIIDTKQQYLYASAAVRPTVVREYFPLRISLAKTLLKNKLIVSSTKLNKKQAQEEYTALVASLKSDFAKQEKSIRKELKIRAIDESLALSFYLCNFIHKSKHYPPNGYESSHKA